MEHNTEEDPPGMSPEDIRILEMEAAIALSRNILRPSVPPVVCRCTEDVTLLLGEKIDALRKPDPAIRSAMLAGIFMSGVITGFLLRRSR